MNLHIIIKTKAKGFQWYEIYGTWHSPYATFMSNIIHQDDVPDKHEFKTLNQFFDDPGQGRVLSKNGKEKLKENILKNFDGLEGIWVHNSSSLFEQI